MNFVLKTFYITVLCSGFSQANLCSEGYQHIDGKCSPFCSENCPDWQICTEPNICGCEAGYHVAGNVCRDNCDNCMEDKCTNSKTCTMCKPKYRIINDTYCQPLCRQKCSNGFCAAPDTCQCNSGYQLNPLSKSCKPTCNETCGTDAYCSAPGICTCKPGFHGNASIACQKWCTIDCKNGDCIGPENCVCHKDFQKYDGLCVPFCSKGCVNGDCWPGDECRCWDEGDKLNETTGECEKPPDTDIPFLFSKASNQISTSTERLTAVSSCTSNCNNGFCTSVGICQCNEGFVKAGSIDCQLSVQDDSIRNEDCVEESICQNYSSSSTEQTFLSDENSTTSSADVTSNCQDGCWNGTCIEGVCHEKTSSNKEETTLSPTDVTSNCQNGCWGGTCTEGICQCQEGLILNHDTNDCIMPCEHNCKNGVCNQENKCECNQGYVLQNGDGCVPQCDRECVNSVCVAPIHCECLEGDISQLNLSSALNCLPTCEGVTDEIGCLNGTCVAVNKCQCHMGFIPKPDDRFECVLDLVKKDFVRREVFYAILWSILLLALLIIILLGFLAQRKLRRVSYNVDKIEKNHSTVMFQNYGQPECVL